MNVAEKTDTCAHPPCNCTAGHEGEYCSEYCAEAPGEFPGSCQCGHPECVNPTP